MNSKRHLINEAERLFVEEYMTIEEIADKLHTCIRTISNWKNECSWDKKRKAFLNSKQSFHGELFEFARKLMKGISEDLDAGEKIDTGRMYAFCRLIPLFTKVKTYEEDVSHKEVDKTYKGLTPDLIAQIEEEVLGIRHDDDNTETE